MGWTEAPYAIIPFGEAVRRRSGQLPAGGMTRTVLLVTGMRDSECHGHVAAALEAVVGVREVIVSLFRAQASVFHEPHVDGAELIRAVANAGYGATIVPAVKGTEGATKGPETRP